jgi:phospho-N-acetylmuramoyl-pentapeptide-transferase
MLHYFLYPLHEQFSAFNVFKYITFRSFGAAITAVLLSMLLSPWYIALMQKKQMKQVIRELGPQSHFSKKGTPTMGGALILGSIAISTLLWGDLENPSIWICLLLTLSYGAIGFVDDFKKVIQKNPRGLPGRWKLVWQFVFATLAVIALQKYSGLDSVLHFPIFKEWALDLGGFYTVFAILVIVGASNAVNLTDGLDGLAVGPTITTSVTFLILCYCAGHALIANYLQIPHVSGAGELAIFLASVAASCLGFLWYNTYPAQVFMGDVGALALGGALGSVAVISKNELVLSLCGGIFVVEALSVMIQVFSFKLTGKRVFKMAPIHHHFELKGWPEPKVIVRFWIISILLALITLSTLKLR